MHKKKSLNVDVVCAGFACHDIVFDVEEHPGPDDKTRATSLVNCGGGLASNAAVASARLGHSTAFIGYVGNDAYGDMHIAEFHADNVNTDWIIRGDEPTPLSAIIVKPDGLRTIVNHRGNSEGNRNRRRLAQSQQRVFSHAGRLCGCIRTLCQSIRKKI